MDKIRVEVELNTKKDPFSVEVAIRNCLDDMDAENVITNCYRIYPNPSTAKGICPKCKSALGVHVFTQVSAMTYLEYNLKNLEEPIHEESYHESEIETITHAKCANCKHIFTREELKNITPDRWVFDPEVSGVDIIDDYYKLQ